MQRHSRHSRHSKFVLPLAVAGALFLAASPFLFHYPPFGWGVWGLISLLFLFGMRSTWRELRRLEGEMVSLERAKEGEPWSDPQDGSEISLRIQTLKSLSQKARGPIDFSEMLSARESSRGVPVLSGAVVMLGLIGTFYGLMVVIASAGPAVQQQSVSYDVGMVLQPVFSGMRGIFGTSLCGLVAALVLNLARAMHQETQMRFMAEIEEFTRFRLLPSFVEESAAPGTEVVFAIDQLTSRLEQLREKIAASFRTLQEGLLSTSSSVKESVDGASGSMRSLFVEQMASQSESSSRLLLALEALVTAQSSSSSASLESAERAAATTQSALVEQSTLQREQASRLLEGIESLSSSTALHFASLTSTLEHSSQSIGSAFGAASEEQHRLQQEERSQLLAAAETLSTSQSAGFTQLEESLCGSISSLGTLLQAQSLSSEEKEVPQWGDLLEGVRDQSSQLVGASETLSDAVSLIKANQVEFQSGLEMFNQGIEDLLDGLQRGREDENLQNSYFERLENALAFFSERAAETIAETSLHTQEILLEVLRRTGEAAEESSSTAQEEE